MPDIRVLLLSEVQRFASLPLPAGTSKAAIKYRDQSLAVLSTGVLERALAERVARGVYVVTTAAELGQHCDWVKQALAPGHLFCAQTAEAGEDAAERAARYLAPWQALYEALGMTWGKFRTWHEARAALALAPAQGQADQGKDQADQGPVPFL